MVESLILNKLQELQGEQGLLTRLFVKRGIHVQFARYEYHNTPWGSRPSVTIFEDPWSPLRLQRMTLAPGSPLNPCGKPASPCLLPLALT